MKRGFISLILLGLVLSVFAKIGKEHIRDMHSVFGLSERHENLQEMFQAITDMMDKREVGLSKAMKEIAPGFSEGNYSHRIYFHWGFNGNPRDSLALAEKINAATDDDATKEALYGKVIAAQKRRNRKTMEIVRRCCTDSSDRSKALTRAEMNALAALAYDVHILGDYIDGVEKTTKALIPMEKVGQDICRIFDRLAKEDEEFRNHPDRKLLQQQLRHQIKMASYSASQKDAAEKMLKAIKDLSPKLLLCTGRIRKTLKLIEIEEEQQYRKAA